jgi:hypothetical protein
MSSKVEYHDPCQICQMPSQTNWALPQSNLIEWICVRCGHYEWQTDVGRNGEAEWQVRLAGHIWDENGRGAIPRFDNERVNFVVRTPRPKLRSRALRALKAFVSSDDMLTGKRPMRFTQDPAVQAASYSENPADLEFLAKFLRSDGLIIYEGGGPATLTLAGYVAIENAAEQIRPTFSGFIAMSFDNSMDEAHTLGFRPGISSAGYQPVRIDQKEHANAITDEILSEIRRSRFVVADYTGAKAGVYFEAGFALGLGIPVIPTCRSDEIANLHFDVRHINTIAWNDSADLHMKLARRISAMFGDGPLWLAAAGTT